MVKNNDYSFFTAAQGIKASKENIIIFWMPENSVSITILDLCVLSRPSVQSKIHVYHSIVVGNQNILHGED